MLGQIIFFVAERFEGSGEIRVLRADLADMTANLQLRLLPVIILTGHPSSSAIENAYKLGANAFHEKPVSFDGMVDLVKLLYTAWSQARRPSL